MSVLIGLENGETAALRAALAKDGEIDKTVVEFLHRAVFPQSVGWMLHTKAACVVMEVCANTIRRIKRIMATLPGVRRVFFMAHNGVKYPGLLVGDYVESDSYPVVSWVNPDGVEIDGVPPKIGQLHPTYFSNDSFTAPVPAGHVGSADTAPTAQEVSPGKKPKTAKGWRKFEGAARRVVEATPARSVRGVALIIRWAVEDQGHDVEDIVGRLVRLGDGVGVTRAALENDLSPANAPTASTASGEVSRETPTATTASAEEITDHGLRRSCEVSVALRPILERRPDLAPGGAVLEAVAQYRKVSVSTDDADRWMQEIRSEVGDFTPAEAFEGVARVAKAGKPMTWEWIARGIRGQRV